MGMGLRVVGRTLAVLVVFSLFAGCGELDSLFSPGESYQLTALINGNSLNGCSMIRFDDEIRPFFAASVENDPDLTGLLVYVQNSRGRIIGEQVLYMLQPHSGNAVGAAVRAVSVNPDTDTAETPEETGEFILGEQAALGFADEITVREGWSFINPLSAPEKSPVVVAVRSLNQEMPYFPLPENMEVGPYKLVFEALGKKETLYRAESDIFYLGNTELSVKDISIFLPGVSDSQLIPPGTTVMLEPTLDFDSRLDPYVVWYDGKNVIGEGKASEGAGTILWTAPERAGFYSLRLEILPFHLKGNFAGIIREIALPVSSGATATAMATGYFFGEGPEYPALSPLSVGTIFPKRMEMEAKDTQPSLERPALLRWYQFEGSLRDTIAGLNTEESMVPVGSRAPLWATGGQTYGLSSGPEDAYLLPPISFFRGEGDQGGGIFLLHAKSLDEGAIFSAFFPLQSSSAEGAKIDVLRKGNAFTLRLQAHDATVDLPLYLPFFEPQTFIPIAVEFYIRPYRLEAKMSLGNNEGDRRILASVEGNVSLTGALAGDARVWLGGGEVISSRATTTAVPAEPAQARGDFDLADSDVIIKAISATVELDNSANTIWDEFAVLYSSLPIQEEIMPVVEEPIEETAIVNAEPSGRVIKVEVTLEYRDNIDPADLPEDIASYAEEGQAAEASHQALDETSPINMEDTN